LRICPLIGEKHEYHRTQHIDAEHEIGRQHLILDTILKIIPVEHTMLYTELPHDLQNKAFTRDSLLRRLPHAFLLQTATEKKIPITYSAITCKMRANEEQKGNNCDLEYAQNIIDKFESSHATCLIASMGLYHVKPISKILKRINPDLDILVLSSLSKKQFLNAKSTLSTLKSTRASAKNSNSLKNNIILNEQNSTMSTKITEYRDMLMTQYGIPISQLLDTPQSNLKLMTSLQESIKTIAELKAKIAKQDAAAKQDASQIYEPIVLKNAKGKTIIQCPICKNISGTLIDMFTHHPTCENKLKTPNPSALL
jgi:hypothetical protein